MNVNRTSNVSGSISVEGAMLDVDLGVTVAGFQQVAHVCSPRLGRGPGVAGRRGPNAADGHRWWVCTVSALLLCQAAHQSD